MLKQKIPKGRIRIQRLIPNKKELEKQHPMLKWLTFLCTSFRAPSSLHKNPSKMSNFWVYRTASPYFKPLSPRSQIVQVILDYEHIHHHSRPVLQISHQIHKRILLHLPHHSPSHATTSAQNLPSTPRANIPALNLRNMYTEELRFVRGLGSGGDAGNGYRWLIVAASGRGDAAVRFDCHC